MGYISITNVYIAPKDTINSKNLDTLFTEKTIIVGDLNAKSKLWGSPFADKRGLIIEELLEKNNFVTINNGQPTYTHYNGTEHHLDICLLSNTISNRGQFSVLNNNMGSDHNPIKISLFECCSLINDTEIPARFNFKKADWLKYKENSKLAITNALCSNNIDTYYENIVNAVSTAAYKTIPKNNRSKRKQTKLLPYWNSTCNNAVKERNRARNKMVRKNLPENCENYRRLKGQAQFVIKNEAKQHWENYCSTLNSHTKLGDVWRMNKKMSGQQHTASIPTIIENNTLYETNESKAELFAQTYANISSDLNHTAAFQATKQEQEQQNQHLFTNEHPTDPQVNTLNENFNLNELRRAIRTAKANKAPGEDNIPYELIQKLPKPATKLLLSFINQVWETGILPNAWRHSIVIPAIKPGKNPAQANSYRPISLTSTLCKIMERLVTDRLTYYLEKEKLITNLQSGFRKNRNTMDHILRLQNDINYQKHFKGYTLAVFLDFKSAFDMLWQKGLLIKLKKLGVLGKTFTFVEKFLENRTIQVRIGNKLSSKYPLQNGTAQGSIISPLLFSIMINDLPDVITNAKSSLFADDSCIFKSGRNLDQLESNIQKNLTAIEKWCNEWGFRLSTEKTVAVLFTNRQVDNQVKLRINNNAIKIEKSAKFLGVIFDSKLTWNQHVQYIQDKCKKRLNLMRSISGQTWGASKKTLLTIYRSLIRSILDYGCIVYDSISEANKKKLDSIQYQALKIATGAITGTSASTLQVDTGEKPLELRREELQIKYAVKVKAISDHPARDSFQPNRLNKSRKFKKGNRPIYCKVQDFFETYKDIQVEQLNLPSIPPWQINAPTVDLNLANKISKHSSPEIIKTLALDVINEHSDSIHIYTDGSKTSDGRVGSAYHVPLYNENDVYRLTDNQSIYTAELLAIKQAIHWILGNEKAATANFVIFSDSLSSLQSIEHMRSTSRPNLVTDILELSTTIADRLTYVWIPSHVGILGNEIADKLAVKATTLPSVTKTISFETHDVLPLINKYIETKWQSLWDTDRTGRSYFRIEPKVSTKIKYSNSNRKKELVITRLRFGKCKLNSHLHKIKIHATGLCSQCNTPETIQHFLMECNTPLVNCIKTKCQTLPANYTIENILKIPQLQEIITTNTKRIL